MVEVANNLVCECVRFQMKTVVWKMGLWLDVRRDPFQFCIQFLPTSQEIPQFVLPMQLYIKTDENTLFTFSLGFIKWVTE